MTNRHPRSVAALARRARQGAGIVRASTARGPTGDELLVVLGRAGVVGIFVAAVRVVIDGLHAETDHAAVETRVGGCAPLPVDRNPGKARHERAAPGDRLDPAGEAAARDLKC